MWNVIKKKSVLDQNGVPSSQQQQGINPKYDIDELILKKSDDRQPNKLSEVHFNIIIAQGEKELVQWQLQHYFVELEEAFTYHQELCNFNIATPQTVSGYNKTDGAYCSHSSSSKANIVWYLNFLFKLDAGLYEQCGFFFEKIKLYFPSNSVDFFEILPPQETINTAIQVGNSDFLWELCEFYYATLFSNASKEGSDNLKLEYSELFIAYQHINKNHAHFSTAQSRLYTLSRHLPDVSPEERFRYLIQSEENQDMIDQGYHILCGYPVRRISNIKGDPDVLIQIAGHIKILNTQVGSNQKIITQPTPINDAIKGTTEHMASDSNDAKVWHIQDKRIDWSYDYWNILQQESLDTSIDRPVLVLKKSEDTGIYSMMLTYDRDGRKQPRAPFQWHIEILSCDWRQVCRFRAEITRQFGEQENCEILNVLPDIYFKNSFSDQDMTKLLNALFSLEPSLYKQAYVLIQKIRSRNASSIDVIALLTHIHTLEEALPIAIELQKNNNEYDPIWMLCEHYWALLDSEVTSLEKLYNAYNHIAQNSPRYSAAQSRLYALLMQAVDSNDNEELLEKKCFHLLQSDEPQILIDRIYDQLCGYPFDKEPRISNVKGVPAEILIEFAASIRILNQALKVNVSQSMHSFFDASEEEMTSDNAYHNTNRV